MHMEDMAVFLVLHTTSGTRAEEREQNKSYNYHSQTVTAKIRVNVDSKIDYVSLLTLEGFLHPWISEVSGVSELSKPPGQTDLSMHYFGDFGLISGSCSPCLGTGTAAGGEGACDLSPYLPHSPRKRKKK